MFNKVIFLGNLTKNIDVKYSPNGTVVGTSSIASNYKYKSNTGEQKDETCFLDFTLFGRSAEVANQYLKKGSKVLLEGRLVLETWTGQDGNQRSKHSLRVDNMKMIGKDEPSYQTSETLSQDRNETYKNKPQNQEKEINMDEINEDEIPF